MHILYNTHGRFFKKVLLFHELHAGKGGHAGVVPSSLELIVNAIWILNKECGLHFHVCTV